MQNLEAVNWQKWVGEHKDRLGAPSKTHLSEDGAVTLCGKAIPSYYDGYEVQGQATYTADCNKCCNKAA